MQGLTRANLSGAGAARPAPGRPAGARPQPARSARRDPGPSRLAYRLNRLWLTPIYRKLLRVGLPVFVLCMVAGIWLSDDARRARLQGGVDSTIDRVQHYEAFMVNRMEIEGASPAVDKGLRAMLPVTLPASSFDIDLTALRGQVEKLDAVERVDLRIKPGGVLSAVVTERQPAVLWRHARGIDLLDRTGHRVASITGRDMRPDLPMIAGEGAGAAAAEALALIDAAGPILPRLRGLERMGERRWDLVLDRGQRIMLPAARPVPALERAMEMQASDGALDRDVTALDLRDPTRPVLRMGLTAQNTLRHAQGLPELGPDGKVIEPDESSTAGKVAGAVSAPKAAAKPGAKAAPKADKKQTAAKPPKRG